jgi:outer membrane protein, multidrug efflux system
MVELVIPIAFLMKIQDITNPNLKLFTFLSILGVLLYGCALSKQPEHKQVVADAFPDSTIIPGLWVSQGDTSAVDNNWLRTFNDPGLDSIVAEALRNNFDLRSAAANVEKAQQNVIVVAARMKPQVGIGLGYDATADDGEGGIYGSSKVVGLASWEPDVWGKMRAQKEAATAEYEATALDFKFAQQSLAAVTAKSWYLTVETSQFVSLYEQVVGIYTEILELVKTRRMLGKVGDLDVAEASANLNAAQNGLIQSVGLFAEARRNLEVLVGRYPAAEIVTATEFSPLPPPVKAGIPSLLLERRPDLIAAENLVIAAFRYEEAANLALLPTFSLSLGAGRLSDVLFSVLKMNPWLATAGIGMSIPVYTAGRLPAQIKIATAKQQQAVANYGNVCLTAFYEVENCLMYEDLLAQQLPYQLNVVANRSDAVRIARLKYESGKIDLLSVLQLQNAQIASQEELIKLRNAQLANRISLHLALGGNFN